MGKVIGSVWVFQGYSRQEGKKQGQGKDKLGAIARLYTARQAGDARLKDLE